jgi:DNA topoisomerase I
MDLVIVESPTKVKTITKYLGKNFKVAASYGHIRDLPKKSSAVDVKHGFAPIYEIPKEKMKVVDELKKLAEKADTVYLSTDPDREGEAIAWHIAELLHLKNPKRVVFHEITESAVKEAFTHPRPIDINLKEAQEARRVLDRLVGYDLSGLIWKKLRYGLSAGRVQSPALRILVEREREIRSFIPEKFWVIGASLETKKKDLIPFLCSEEPKTQEEADRILAAAKSGTWKVEGIKETEMSRTPRAPFTTATLQQSASSRLGLSPSKTMFIAQRLYEAGHISYMRTDSTHLSKEVTPQIEALIAKKYGANYVSPRTFAAKSKLAQEAHEAIRPTNVNALEAGDSEEQRKLYKLIWKRTITSQMSDAKFLKTKISAVVSDSSIPAFAANGSRTIFDGWLAADPAARGEEVELPQVKADDPLTLREITSEEKQTLPPNRYSEAGLVKELEKRGIGRPSTYASIIQTLVARKYVEKEQKALRPTDTGEVVSGFLEKYFANIISDSFTAEMEDELDDIASGKRGYTKTLADFYGPFSKEIKASQDIPKLTTLGDADPKIKCPKCGEKMVVKLSKNGTFLSCSRFPDCTGARTIEGEALAEPKETGEACPECGKGMLIERESKYGKFVSCNRYPKCKYIKKDAVIEGQKMQNTTGVKCPSCNAGEIVERKGRFGIFFSCSNYPKCKFAIKAKPTGNLCPMCGSLMMEGTKTIPERCSNKTCANHNPHKLEKK